MKRIAVIFCFLFLGLMTLDYVVAEQIICDGKTCRVVPGTTRVQILAPNTNVVQHVEQSAPKSIVQSVPAVVSVQAVPVQYQETYTSNYIPAVGSATSDGGIVTSVSVSEVQYVQHNSVRTPVRTVVRSIANRRRERVSSNGVWFPGKGLIRFLRG